MGEKKEAPEQEKEMREERYRKRYRVNEMKEKLDSLSAVCFGRNEDMRQVLLGPEGELSEESLRGFAEELTRLAEECRGMLHGPGFTKEERELIQSLIIICVIIAGEPKQERFGKHTAAFAGRVSFEKLNQMMKTAYPPMTEEEYADKYETPGANGGFEDYMHLFFDIHLITGMLGMDFHPEMKQKPSGKPKRYGVTHLQDSMNDARQDEEDEIWLEEEELNREIDEAMAKAAAENEPPQEVLDQLAEDYLQEQEDYRAHFPLQDMFLQACRTYRRLVFTAYPENLDRIAEMAIDYYLLNHDLSPLAKKEDFWHVVTECGVAANRIARRSWKGGRK